MKIRSIALLVLLLGSACKDKTPPAKTDAPATPTAQTAADSAPGMATDAVAGFAGFSADGTSFAWVAPSPMAADVIKLAIIGVGEAEAKMQYVDTPDGRAKGKSRLLSDGFTSARRAVPSDVTFEADLAASPPTVTLIRAGKRGVRPVGDLAFDKTDVVELWGMSTDGTHVAIHVHAKDAPDLLSGGNGGSGHAFFIAQLP